MKKILTIQDISCIGKCSLTVALPIISSMGIETAILPTAVLSTHTQFKGFTFHDLTGEIKPICEHWKSQKIEFDAIYTGYLGSFEQINLVSGIFDDFGKNILKFVDPAMGDNGVLYTGFDRAFAHEMAKLCAKADIIVPNLTEACFMLDIPYIDEGYSEDYVKDVLIKLTGLGCKKAVLTGISLTPGKLGIYGYDSENNLFKRLAESSERIPNHISLRQINARLKLTASLAEEISKEIAMSIDGGENVSVIDSKSVKVCQMAHARRCVMGNDNPQTAPAKGFCASRQMYYEYKHHAVCGISGIIHSYDFTATNIHDIHYLDDVKW